MIISIDSEPFRLLGSKQERSVVGGLYLGLVFVSQFNKKQIQILHCQEAADLREAGKKFRHALHRTHCIGIAFKSRDDISSDILEVNKEFSACSAARRIHADSEPVNFVGSVKERMLPVMGSGQLRKRFQIPGMIVIVIRIAEFVKNAHDDPSPMIQGRSRSGSAFF